MGVRFGKATSIFRDEAIVGFVLFAWLAVAWVSRPPIAVLDWMGWRQADTQTIAVNLLEPGSSMLRPRIAWGGDGPGYVEAEFQLYTAAAAFVMRATGKAEWASELVSFACAGAALVVLWLHLKHHYDSRAALFGVGAALGARSVHHAATAIQPEALCLLAYTVAWACIRRYASGGARRWLVAFAASGAVAMLVKPTAAHLGISSAILLLFGPRHLLRRWETWLAAALMLAALGFHLLEARSVYLAYGNTFGVLSGGDSKLPRIEHLFMPRTIARAAVLGVTWGTGYVGALALIVLVALRRVKVHHAALFAGNAVWILLALRYTSNELFGSMYFLLASVLAAEAAAAVSASFLRDKRWLEAVCALALALTSSHMAWLRYRASREPDDDSKSVYSAGIALGKVATSRDLVVVRSPTGTYDEFWRTKNNYEDPRVFYVSSTRGWVLGNDERGVTPVRSLAERGARFYVEASPLRDAELDEWLSRHATLVSTTEHGGRVFRLTTAPGSSG